MKRFRFSSAFVVFLALLAVALDAPPALAQQETEPSGTEIEVSKFDLEEITYPELGDFKVPQPERIELENGLTVFLLEDHTLPQISAIARIGAGSVWAPDSTAGLVSITGTVMRTGGTAEMSPTEINQALANVGATVETGIGSTSGFAYMNTLKEHVGTVLPLFASVLRNPAFAKEKVQLAKQQMKTQISRRNENPQQIAFREMSQRVYGQESPYARVPQYYTVGRIGRQDVVRFYEAWVHPSNTILSFWGDFDADQIAQKIREAFGDWERAEDFERPKLPTVEGDREYAVYFIPKSDVTQSTILMGHVGSIMKSNPDYFPVIIVNQVLSGGFTSRLFKNVRSEQGLAYAVFGSYVVPYARAGLFRAGVFSKSATTVEAANAVLEQIRRMRQVPPTEQELQVAKQSFLNSFVFNFNTRREILERLMTYEYYGYPATFLEQVREGVQQVSAQDVLRVSKKYLHPDALDVLVLGNKNDFNESLSALTKGGEVKTIDISIPTQPPGAKEEPAATAEQQAAGQELLMQVRDALGGAAFDRIESFRTAGTTTIATRRGERTVENSVTVRLPAEIHAEVTLPTGRSMTIAGSADQMTMQTPRGTQPAPANLRKQTMSQLWRSLPYLLARADAVEAAAAGTVEVEGQTYQALDITSPQGSTFTLLLNPETARPARMQYTATTRQGPAETMAVLSDYREVNGITIPFKMTTYRNGQLFSTTTLTAFEVNPDLEEGLFSVE